MKVMCLVDIYFLFRIIRVRSMTEIVEDHSEMASRLEYFAVIGRRWGLGQRVSNKHFAVPVDIVRRVREGNLGRTLHERRAHKDLTDNATVRSAIISLFEEARRNAGRYLRFPVVQRPSGETPAISLPGVSVMYATIEKLKLLGQMD